MNPFPALLKRDSRPLPVWLDLLRVVLGLLLFSKGLSFIINKDLVQQILHENNFEFIPVLIMHVVIIFQMAHSVLIAVGLVTRIAILMQLPIVLGALYLLATRTEFSVFSSDIWLAVIVVFLLVFFLVEGPGPFSIDARLRVAQQG